MDQPKLVIIVEGGLIRDIFASPSLPKIDLTVIDHDINEGENGHWTDNEATAAIQGLTEIY